MKRPDFNMHRHDGGAILEGQTPLQAIFGWLSGDDGRDGRKRPSCDFTPM